jgi:Fe-S-cluster containining protein
MKCLRCGSCCYADMTINASEEDFVRWDREMRHDIMDTLKHNEKIWAGDSIVLSSGKKLTRCSFLLWDGEMTGCSIYETRPLVCKNYQPGSSLLCPLKKSHDLNMIS